MGLFDSIKDAVVDHKKEVEQGLDKAEEVAHAKLPDNLDDKIDTAVDKAKDAVEKLE